MIEPTETETQETLDAFCDAMLAIADEAQARSRARQERAAHDRARAASTRPRAARKPAPALHPLKHPARPRTRRPAHRRGGRAPPLHRSGITGRSVYRRE